MERNDYTMNRCDETECRCAFQTAAVHWDSADTSPLALTYIRYRQFRHGNLPEEGVPMMRVVCAPIIRIQIVSFTAEAHLDTIHTRPEQAGTSTFNSLR